MKQSFFCILIFLPFLYQCQQKIDGNRDTISLNGTWEIAESITDDPDGIIFKGKVAVPGLADLAIPKLDSLGYDINARKFIWYKREFSLEDQNHDIVRFKLYKAKYGIKIWINGKVAGIHMPSFTPYEVDINNLLNEPGKPNEVLIRMGAHKDVLPDTVADGFDFEKVKYIPGIYDDVEIILADAPYIKSIQIIPDIVEGKIDVQTVFDRAVDGKKLNVEYVVREWKSQSEIARAVFESSIEGLNIDSLIFPVEIDNPKLWSPESPFLYELEVITEGDRKRTRFGMREFSLDPETGMAMLNGKPYYMRGTNVCIYRFMEDPERGILPWDPDWVRSLHQKFKSMHWNSIRYCIGFPPEMWYDIADEEGLLIQDEFPIWYGYNISKEAPALRAEHIAMEYTEWMRERWNHPCVVIWDAQNETITKETGNAIEMVRRLDLSGRPWDNGWAAPMSDYDVNETHPYLFTKYFGQKSGAQGPLAELITEKMIPENGPDQHSPAKDSSRYKSPIIINEYGWLWLNRDGSYTTLTEPIYPNAFPGENIDDIVRRRKLYYMNLGNLSEYWRSYRTCAGVLHFCGLGYSRNSNPYGQTSDNFIDIANLEFDPYFVEYVKPSFNPVGVMIDYWNKIGIPGEELKVPVHVINDLYIPYSGELVIEIRKEDTILVSQNKEITVEPLGKIIEQMNIVLPDDSGDYFMIAELMYNDESIKSTREITIK